VNILLCTRTFDRKLTGGVANSLYHLALQYVSEGNSVLVFAERQPGEPAEETIGGVRVFRHRRFFRFLVLRELPFYMYALRKKLRTIVEAEEIDMVVCRHLYYSWAVMAIRVRSAYLLASFFPLESIEFMRSNSTSTVKKIYLYLQSLAQGVLERSVVSKAIGLATLSSKRKSELIQLYDVPAHKVRVIPPGVDTAKFIPSKNRKPLKNYLKMEGDRHLQENRVVIVSVCRQEWRKNLDGLIRGFASNEFLRENATLVLVGEGSQSEYLNELTQKLSLQNEVHLVGYQKNTVDWYNVGDIFVLPSFQEGFGQVFLEAMACGLPCVAYGRGKNVDMPTPEIVVDGVTGYVADLDVPNDLEKGLSRIVQDGEIRATMALAARERVLETFEWQLTAKGLMEHAELN
jgi:glycosyltransferase involved in cell wall biosynthesis